MNFDNGDLNFSDDLVSNMLKVRNDWSHIRYDHFPGNKVTRKNLRTVICFLECFGDKRAVSAIVREIKDWINC